MILGGDLGGTKTLLALAEIDGGRWRIVRQQRYASREFPSFDDLLGEFLRDAPPIRRACFGLAGPTDGQSAKLTYLPWQLSASALQTRFKLAKVTLINDFAAAANGLDWMNDDEVLSLHAGRPIARAPRVILGAGTGLGVAGLIWQEGAYRVIPGEGGHFGFSPQTPRQAELWRALCERKGRVTVEDIVSGPGLSTIFDHFSGRPQEPEKIAQDALSGRDPLARQALELWLECYGAFAGDLALLWLARGGVYLSGGIAGKLLPQIDATPLLSAYLAKREHAALVADMPLSVLTAEDLGLRGALACAATSTS